MAKVPEVRLGPLQSESDLRQALMELAVALNKLIAAFNEGQPD